MISTPVSPSIAADKIKHLQREGYCILENMAGEALLNRTRDCVNKAVAEQDSDKLARTISSGTLISSVKYPELSGIIGNPAAIKALDDMGLPGSKFWKAVIISKPPGGPRLYWYQDCMMWQDPRAYSDFPPMTFLMYYLDDTTRENGCLRVLPGTHRKRHLHPTVRCQVDAQSNNHDF